MLFLLTLLAALGCAVISGVFFAFSTFVMRALGRLPAPHGIAAMQSVNIAAITPLFLTAFLGTGAICLSLSVLALVSWDRPGSAWRLVGSALYLVGVVGVTRAFNIPLAMTRSRPSIRTARQGTPFGHATGASGRPGTMCGRSRRSPRPPLLR